MIPMILPIHQHPSDLTLNILTNKLQHPVTVLQHHTLQLGMWSFRFHIIGESHLVTIERDNMPVLSELLACVKVDAEACLHHYAFHDLRPHCFEQRGYSIAVEFKDTDETEPFEADGMIEVGFPEIAGQTPLTRIAWSQIGDQTVRWQTLHMYPDEKTLICVHSLSHFNGLNYNRAL